ncbi:2-C-methyl-D-erythritol 2,4-cyclodiphosphate synthase [Actimicrobium sp. CCI2.3]|nr:2-C-methyl-D-erythritol 2,4-cyclodiphosphate synthase [Actimicrobium sp. CCI2.3]MDY7574650.1 2-C-methyl-D-erythritol 2,4-cyclodiphosphate synthase [Actimicrobium sp. CCI2.3]MEB0020393.1 2-C-methyl-D-erythritol 2,4-cyclodiphosphate synthase [Actimicrobium sp. CCI2.3]
MVTNIAEAIGIPAGRVNVKTKTNERMGFLGREEGMAAEAVVLIYHR